jgi:hypothetical protein
MDIVVVVTPQSANVHKPSLAFDNLRWNWRVTFHTL